MKLKTLLVLSTSMVMTSTAFSEGWVKPIPTTQDIVKDGTAQYLYNATTESFMLGANDYETRGSASRDKGMPWKIEEQTNGTYALVDSVAKFKEWRKTFVESNSGIWVDNNTGANCNTWTLTDLGNGKYKIGNTAFADEYLGIAKDFVDTRLYLTSWFTSKDPAIEADYEWTSVSIDAYQEWETAHNVYAAAMKLQTAIEDAKKLYPSINLAAEETVFNNTASTLEELQAAIDGIPAKLKAAAEADMLSATYANPKDVSTLINNRSFDKQGDFAGWEGDKFGAGGTASTAAEHFSKNYNTYQTIKDLPAGVYKVNADGFYRAGEIANDFTATKEKAKYYAKIYGANVTANGEDIATASIMHLFDPIKPGEQHLDKNGETIGVTEYKDGETAYYIPNTMLDFTNVNGTTKEVAEGKELYKTNSVMFPVSEGTAKIGVKKDSKENNDWTIVDNFGLTYYGNGADAWDALMKDYAANATLPEGNVTKSIIAAFNDAVSKANATDYQSYKTSVEAIDVTKKAAEENIAAWAAYKALADQAEKMLNDGTYMSIATNLADYIKYDYTDFIKDLELSTEDVKKETETLQALYDNAKSETPAGTEVTNMLKNTDFSQGWEGWEHNSDGGTVVANKDTKCAEAWNSKNFDIYQEISNAPVGVYQIQVQGFYRYANGNDEGWLNYFNQNGTERTDHNEFITNSPAYIYLNDAKTSLDNIYKFKAPYDEANPYYKTEGLAGPKPYIDPNKEYWYPNDMTNAGVAFDDGKYVQSAFGLVAKQGDPLRIGVKGNTEDGTSWCIFTRFKLIYQGFDANIIKPELEKAMNSINAEALMGSDIAQDVKKAVEDGNAALAQTDGKVMFDALAAIYAIQTKAAESEKLFKNLLAQTETFNEALSNSDDARPAIIQQANTLSTEVTAAIEGKTYTDAQAQQAIADMTKLAKKLAVPADIDNASDEKRAEITNVITNNSFETGDLTGWTTASGTGDTGSKENSNGTYTINNADGSYVFNTWNSSAVEGGFFVAQDIEDIELPSGTYELTCIVASDANNKQQVIVNNNVTEVTTNDKATGEEVSVVFKLENDNDKISIKVASESWFKADNFQLFYYGKNSSKENSVETGIEDIVAKSAAIDIYTINGVKVATLQNGLNIIRTKNGVKKVMKK
jgi:hypothetical protein